MCSKISIKFFNFLEDSNVKYFRAMEFYNKKKYLRLKWFSIYNIVCNNVCIIVADKILPVCLSFLNN